MGQRIDEGELRRRAIAGIRDEVEAFGSGAPDSFLIREAGLTASATPSTPQRSLFNSVFYEDPAVLVGELDRLAETYHSHGIDAWTVWVPDEDRETARLLADRDYLLDAAPRAMAMRLDELTAEPPVPAGVEARPGDSPTSAALNDRAYGYERPAFRAALAEDESLGWLTAYERDEGIACVGWLDVGDDRCITSVATPPEHRGRGLASWLLWRALAAARDQGLATASLQATKAGAPLYERFGFADFGFIEMWERRR
jgi:GNAT superfamily N-acetyltransferase